MKFRTHLAAVVATGALLLTAGCAVTRGQETAGEYAEDAKITTVVKARMVEDKSVDAAAIKVQTLKGTVQLSGFAKSATEKAAAERIAAGAAGVTSVRNDIIIRP